MGVSPNTLASRQHVTDGPTGATWLMSLGDVPGKARGLPMRYGSAPCDVTYLPTHALPLPCCAWLLFVACVSALWDCFAVEQGCISGGAAVCRAACGLSIFKYALAFAAADARQTRA